MSDGYAQKLDLQDYGVDSAKSDKILVVGNGESRIGFSFESRDIPIIGCNALHRDFAPDHLICCDRRMIEEAVSNIDTKNCKIYVRDRWHHYYKKIKKNKNILLLPDIPFPVKNKSDEPGHWGSGPYAILLACILDYTDIHIIGFDLYPRGKTVNNIYKGSENYALSDNRPVDPSYWIYQISKIIHHFKNKRFFFYNSDHWVMPDEWNKNNVQLKNILNIDVDIK